MSVEVVPGGHRRIDRAPDPGFTEEIADGAGSRFDPAVVDALTAIAPRLPDLSASPTSMPPCTRGPSTTGPRTTGPPHDGPPARRGSVDSLARAIP